MASSPMVTKWVGAHTDNYTVGRGGYKVEGIVIHHAVTTNINVSAKYLLNLDAMARHTMV